MLTSKKVRKTSTTVLPLLLVIASACNRSAPAPERPSPPVGSPSSAPVTFHVSAEHGGTITDPKQSVHPLQEVNWQANTDRLKFTITFLDPGGSPCKDSGDPSLKQAEPYTLSCVIKAHPSSTYKPYIQITTMTVGPTPASPHLCPQCTMTISPTP